MEPGPTTSEPTPSTLDSVVILDDTMGQWTAIPSHHPLSQLRDKFWEFSMKDEEDEWRRDRPEDERLAVDEDDENMENEIGSGCYRLDFGIQDLARSELWIRKDYIRIYDCCEEFYNDIKRFNSGIAPSVIITGQPGIGKTYWIRYALRRRLGEGKPVIWYRGDRCYLFAGDGVFLAPSNHQITSFKTFVWTLADSDDLFPSHLAKQDTKHFLLYTTSPHRERWAPLEKITHFAILFMNPWTREEIFQAAPLHGLEDTDRTRINELYDRFGPTPRTCFDFLKNRFQLISHEHRYQSTVNSLTAERLRRFVSDSTQLKLDDAFHSIFLVKRPNIDDLAEASMEPISTLVKSGLQKRIRALEQGEQIRLYKYLAPMAGSRQIAGLVFESLAQLKLQTNVALEFIPMVKRTFDELTNSSQGSKGKKFPRWYSNHEKKADNFPGGTQTTKRRRTSHQWHPDKVDSSSQSNHHWVKISPTKTVEYRASELKGIQPGIFYVPKLTNEVAFDSFIMANGYFYIFQFSIVSSSSIKPGIVSFFSQPSLPPKTMWRFVFIIPPGSEISCPQPRDPGLNELFSAELDPCN